MKKVYYLSTCSTCKRILKEVAPLSNFVLQDIKFEPLTEKQLDVLVKFAGSYESLFNKRARKFRELKLQKNEFNEADYRILILQDYTFLQRPVFIVEDKIFVGNNKKVIESLLAELGLTEL